MSRVSDLTFQLLDGAIGDADRRELERLVAADEAAAREHIALMEVEGALCAGQPVDVTRETMQRIADVAGSKTGQRVVDRIKQQPRPAWKKNSGIQKPVTGNSARVSGMQPKVTTRRSRARRATPASFAPWLGIAAAVVLIIGVVLFFARSQSSTVEAIATLTSMAPDGRIVRDGRSLTLSAGADLLANDQLSAGSASGTRLEYGDGSSIEISARGSAQILDGHTNASKQLRITQGKLTARVAKQNGKPFVLTTPHATATVLGTELELAVDASSTRLDVSEGSVRIERSSDKRSVVVDGGFFAVAAANQDLVARKIGSDAVVATPPPEKVTPPEPTPPAPPAFGIVAFHLVDTATSQPIRGFSPLEDGAVLELRTLPKGLTLTVVTNPREVAKIVFDVDGKKHFKDEVDPPYSLSTNWIDKATGQDRYNPWTLGVGKHTVTATPYESTKPNAKAGTALTVRFEIVK